MIMQIVTQTYSVAIGAEVIVEGLTSKDSGTVSKKM
jgi:hypothetical protein